MKAKHLIFLGPPGTGKGTQAQLLNDKFGWAAMSSGDILRAEVKAESKIGLAAHEYMRTGALVPDDIITGVILAGLERVAAGRGWILDGFPRTVPQAEALAAGLAKWKLPIDGVIYFNLPDATIIERIVTRRVCKECATTYNVRFSPPKAGDRCDRCGGAVIQREDDREEVIVKRLSTYRTQTAPLIEYYERQGLLRSVDASLAPATVHAAALELLARLDASA